MMKKIIGFLSFIFVILSADGYSANVNGVALLDNSSNHADILVSFMAVSPSALTDSVFTDANGAFDIILQDGIYDIVYSKPGYQDFELPEQFMVNTITLDPVTLSSNGLEYLSGSVSGNWISGTTYIVVGDIFLEETDTLFISPGTEIKFDGFFKFDISGKLYAQGCPDSLIIFTSNQITPAKADWRGIVFHSGDFQISHWLVEYTGGWYYGTGQPMMDVVSGNLLAEYCIFRKSDKLGFKLYEGEAIIRYCDFYDFDDWAIGVHTDPCPAIIEHNQIHGNLVGIIARGGAVIRYNHFYNNSYAISCLGEVTIDNNLFYNNIKAIEKEYSGDAQINNNTFYDNSRCILLDNNGIITAKMNIFSNNNYGIEIVDIPSGYTIDHSLFYNNGVDIENPPLGFGLIITENNNGTPCDTYYNIFEDSDFISTNSSDSSFLHLSANSPCINAGDTAFFDPDGSIMDIGAIPFDQTLSVESLYENETASKVSVFPNPFSTSVEFRIFIAGAEDELLEVYDLSGQLVWSAFVNGNEPCVLTWRTKDQYNRTINPGIYFYRIQNTSGILIKQ